MNLEQRLQYLQEIVAREFYRVGVVQFGAFKLRHHQNEPDAPLSPIYINLRNLRAAPGALDAVVIMFRALIDEICSQYGLFDLLADVPTAVTPIVAVLMDRSRIPMITPRNDRKEHGSGNDIDGLFQSGQKVLLIDDVLVRGQSCLRAIKILEDRQLKVEDVLVVVDREQGGAQELIKSGRRVHSVIKLSTLMAFYLKWNYIDVKRYEEVISYLRGS